MSKLAWYWHRLRAMTPDEMFRHALKKQRQRRDGRRAFKPAQGTLEVFEGFPRLPDPGAAPPELRAALVRDAERILAGDWSAFGRIALKVDDPPRWHRDYLAGVDCDTETSAFTLDHRELPNGADIKLIWELSRWYQPTRLAMAGFVTGEDRFSHKAVAWLEDWTRVNPPFRGWNWTSALEVGMRLIQITWMDALLGRWKAANPRQRERWEAVTGAVVPAHVYYCRRYLSFGSSANNHLLGELAGLIVALSRWPRLCESGAELDQLRRRLEREVLAQFAEDGGNREQALNYQLFSWEFGRIAVSALGASGHPVSAGAEQRLHDAARFFVRFQVPEEPWDFGDSDSAYVSPWFMSEQTVVREWHDWFVAPERSPAINYWMADDSKDHEPMAGRTGGGETDWDHAPESGHAIRRCDGWTLRWDLSPLGYLKTAAHGHLDALHLSIWFRGVVMVIDPGTGCYYADKELRRWLASRSAHNGPCPDDGEWPKRLGPFLWSQHHEPPDLAAGDRPGEVRGGFRSPVFRSFRWISPAPEGRGWIVRDEVRSNSGEAIPFTVRWQFPPGATLKRLDAGGYRLERLGEAIEIRPGGDWKEVRAVHPGGGVSDESSGVSESGDPFAGCVSPSFRVLEKAPYLLLRAAPAGDEPCVFNSTFLVSRGS